MRFAFWLLLSLFLALGDDGIGIDPNGGRCAGGLAGDRGPNLDPDGLAAQGDGGPHMDPNG